MQLRIFRQPTMGIQPNGEFYIDTLQYRTVTIENITTAKGISGIESCSNTYSVWKDVEIVEADSY